MNTNGFLKARAISVGFLGRHGRIPVLDEASVDFPQGSFTAIMGPSGSGKTTLLLSLGGLLQPDAGQVLCDEQEVYPHHSLAHRKRVGFLFQKFHLLPYLSISENISLGLVEPSDCSAQNVMSLMEKLGLSHRADHLPERLSSGEQQRTALARALIRQPSLILADEPCGNLDETNAEIVLDSLTEAAHRGAAVVMVTHSRRDSARADRILRLEGGRLVEE